jgi:hypothetical protein
MKRVGLKVQALIKNQWCYFETVISHINKKGGNPKMNTFQNNKMTVKV